MQIFRGTTSLQKIKLINRESNARVIESVAKQSNSFLFFTKTVAFLFCQVVKFWRSKHVPKFYYLVCIGFLFFAGGASATITNYYVDKRLYGVGYFYALTTPPSDGNTITIGLVDGTTKIYTFRTIPSVDGDVKISTTGQLTMQNLVYAVNCSGGTPGTDYVCSSANPAVSAVFSTPYCRLTAKTAGGVGNVTLAKNGSNIFLSGSRLTDGNGLSTTQATTPGGAGAFNSFSTAIDVAKTPSPGTGNTAIINVIEGSGPYYPTDINSTANNLGIFVPRQTDGTIIWNFNNNVLQWDYNVNDGSYQWNASTSKPGEYYLTMIGGALPTRRAYDGTQIAVVSPGSVIIGDSIYGDWNDDSTNISSNLLDKSNNWDWGDYDGIGFSTLYIKMANELSPSDSSNSSSGVWVAQQARIIQTPFVSATFIFNNGIFRGAKSEIASFSTVTSIRGSILVNSATTGIVIGRAAASGSSAYNSLFINCGHAGISNYNSTVAADFTAYNNVFAYTHTMAKLFGTGSYTFTFKNNISYNLYAFAFQKGTGSTLIESNNIFNLNPYSSHGGHHIAGLGSEIYWASTDSTDLPASTSTFSGTWAAGYVKSAGDLIMPTRTKYTGYAYRVQSCNGNCTTVLEPAWPTSGTVTENPGANQIVWETVSLSMVSASPLFASSSNYYPLYNSSAIDAGTDLSLTADFTGNPIYGTPDIGAYEYQPPHTMGTDNVDISAGARIYQDGKFRDLATTGGTTAPLSIVPQGGFTTYGSTATRPQWMDITAITWNASGTYAKQWTETASGSLVVNHTVGNLQNNAYYKVTIDDSTTGITGTNCTDGMCLSNSSGQITFTYTGHYSTHIFKVADTTPPSNVAISHITIDSPTQLTVVADTPTDSGSGLAAAPYWFQETTGHAGAVSSTDWQTSNSFTNSGLSSNIGYAYKVKVKDAAGNISEYSASVPQTPMAIGGGSSYTATTTPATSTTTTTTPETPTTTVTSATQEPAQQPTQPTQSTETTITQIKSQLIILLTQVIQMLTEQVALMR